MKNAFLISLLFTISIAFCPIIEAQNSYPSELTLEDIYPTARKTRSLKGRDIRAQFFSKETMIYCNKYH